MELGPGMHSTDIFQGMGLGVTTPIMLIGGKKCSKPPPCLCQWNRKYYFFQETSLRPKYFPCLLLNSRPAFSRGNGFLPKKCCSFTGKGEAQATARFGECLLRDGGLYPNLKSRHLFTLSHTKYPPIIYPRCPQACQHPDASLVSDMAVPRTLSRLLNILTLILPMQQVPLHLF